MSEASGVHRVSGSISDLRNGRFKFPGQLHPSELQLGNSTGKTRRNKIHRKKQKLKRRAIADGKAEPVTRDEIIDHELLTYSANHRRELEKGYRENTFRVGNDKSAEIELRQQNTKKTAKAMVKSLNSNEKLQVAQLLNIKLPKLPDKTERTRYKDEDGLSKKPEWRRKVHINSAVKAGLECHYPKQGAKLSREVKQRRPSNSTMLKPSRLSQSIVPEEIEEESEQAHATTIRDSFSAQDASYGHEEGYETPEEIMEDDLYC